MLCWLVVDKMKIQPRFLLLMTPLLVLCFAARAQAASVTLYDIDFGSPPHVVGSSVKVGSGTDTPSRINFGTPTVESSFGALTDQPLVFNPEADTYEQIQLNLGGGYDDYRVSFDLYAANLSGSDYAFTLNFDTPQVQNFSFHGLGSMRTYSPKPDRTPSDSFVLGSFADNTLYHVSIDIDLLAGLWTIGIEDGPSMTHPFYSWGGDVDALRFNLSRWKGSTPHDPTVAVGLDNLLITTGSPVPEPSTALLLGMGVLLLSSCLRQRSRQ